jgi:hypothetical protein
MLELRGLELGAELLDNRPLVNAKDVVRRFTYWLATGGSNSVIGSAPPATGVAGAKVQ